jgi:hypothetical protein
LGVFVNARNGIKNMLEGDDLDSNRVVDFFSLHLDGKVFSTHDLIMLLDIYNWEVNFLHDLSKL